MSFPASRYPTLAVCIAIMISSGCSTSGGSSDATTTEAAIVTTSASPTTTVAGISRDTRLAVQRCLDAAGESLPVTANINGLKAFDDPENLCAEARRQAEVDGADGLKRALHELEITIAGIAVDLSFSGRLDNAQVKKAIEFLGVDARAIARQLKKYP